MTEIRFNGQVADFEQEEVIVATYGNIAFGDFTKKKGIKTNNFRLPITDRNKLIFENAEIIQNASIKPYRYFDVLVVIDGLEVFQGIAYVSESEEYYEITSMAGASRFYNTITNRLLTDLVLTQYNHTNNEITIKNSWNNKDGYIYAYCEYGMYVPEYQANYAYGIVPVAYLKPQAYFHTIIKAIFEQAGYTLQGDVLTNPRYLTHIICYNRYPHAFEFGGAVDFAQTLPDKMKQSALVLDFMNIYGLMLDVDDVDNIITASYIDGILFNEPQDWSNKIDDSEKRKVEYKFDDYAQVNELSFNTDDAYLVSASASMPIDNVTLESEGQIYKSPFFLIDDQTFKITTARNNTTNTFRPKTGLIYTGFFDPTVGYVGGYGSVVLYNGTYYEAVETVAPGIAPDSDPELWKIIPEKDIFEVKVRPVYGVVGFNASIVYEVRFSSEDIIVPKLITAGNLSWTITRDLHYRLLTRAFDKTKIVEHLFKLSYADINQLDFTRPVWLDRYQNLFAIEEVDQFKLNQIDSTNVRLIRI